MLRKSTSSAAAALAVGILGASPAAANGWLFKLHGWPYAPAWGGAALVGENGVSVPGFSDGCPHESADGLSLFIASNREDPNDIWVSDRARIGDPWPAPLRLQAPINSPAGDFCPTPVRGRSLMFVSTRPQSACPGEQAGGGDMYVSRQSPAGGWSEPVHLGCAPNGPNTAGGERSPSLVETPYGTFLFYSTNGNTADGTVVPGADQDIHVSVLRGDGTFGPGKAISALSTPDFDDIMPNVRERPEGGYEMVFSSSRSSAPLGSPPQGAQDVYMSFAWFLPGPWARPVNLGPNVNTNGVEQRATLSHDGKRLYFGRVPAGGSSDIYVSERRHR